MLEKGVISRIVPWERSREFFGHRLQRKLIETRLIDQLRQASPTLSVAQATEQLFRNYRGDVADDAAATQYLTEHRTELEGLAQRETLKRAAGSVAAAATTDTGAAVDALLHALDAPTRQLLLAKLQEQAK